MIKLRSARRCEHQRTSFFPAQVRKKEKINTKRKKEKGKKKKKQTSKTPAGQCATFSVQVFFYFLDFSFF